MKLKMLTLLILGLLAIFSLVACEELTPAEATAVVGTVENMSPAQMAGVVATIENLPPAEAAALEQAVSVLPTLPPEQVTAVVGTVEAAIAQATAGAAAVANGERVNATQAPEQAPKIIYYFASVPSAAAIQGGVRYYLNWTTENANRVEIFGNVMDNPVEGSWPIYNESNNWTLWAANDQVWVEQFMTVEPDKNLGTTLQNVTVDNTQITLSFRDPQLVDGDIVNILVNGQVLVSGYGLQGRLQSFPITLNSGVNTIEVNAQNEGVTPPMVGELTISNVTSGPAVQYTPGLAKGASQSFTITAP